MIQRLVGFLAATLLSVQPVAAAESPAPGDGAPVANVKDTKTGIELVFVKGGCYAMGDVFGEDSGGTRPTDESPVHEVCVRDFYIGKYEVTQGQWKAFMGTNPATALTCTQDDCPVDNVSYSDALQFLRRLNERSGSSKYRLPTEAEWEYAARSGGRNERYSGGNDVESVSWYVTTTGYSAEPQLPAPWARRVGQKAPNGLGIHDMSGNVYEFTSDWYDPKYYATSPRDDPQGPPSGSTRVKRGGCAHGDPGNGRTSRRAQSTGADALLGLRVVKVP
jgi:formylglycine-generating enzyme required for sulfatase activity